MVAARVGVDMLEVARMERVAGRRPSFLARVFTEEERAYCERRPRPAEHYAERWAAREAVLKAWGTGFMAGIGLHDVSVVMDEQGRPQACLAGRAAEIARERGVREIALSLSCTHEVAVASAVAMTDKARPAPSAQKDAARAFAASFKEARGILDELERVQEEREVYLGGGKTTVAPVEAEPPTSSSADKMPTDEPTDESQKE